LELHERAKGNDDVVNPKTETKERGHNEGEE
jgi:hypothetical protein